MTLSAADVGLITFLNARFNNVWPTSKDLTLKLFCNDVTPSDNDTLSTYIEAAGGGYAPKTLTCGSWTVSTVSGIPQASFSEQTFTFTGTLTTNGNVYGYFVVDGDGVLQWGEKFKSGVAPIAGGVIKITPVFQASKGTPS